MNSESTMIDEDDDDEALARARANLMGKGIGTGKKQRRKTEKKIRSTIDGRSLHATGRTHPWSFRCRSEVKDRAVLDAQAKGITLAEWLESAILAYLDE